MFKGLGYGLIVLSFQIIGCSSTSNTSSAGLLALRVESGVTYRDEVAHVEPERDTEIRLFGQRLNEVESILFTADPRRCCKNSPSVTVDADSIIEQAAEQMKVSVRFTKVEKAFYVCLRVKTVESSEVVAVPESSTNSTALSGTNLTETCVEDLSYVFQGSFPYRRLEVAEVDSEHYLPIPLQVVIIVCLLILSGLFSGLNLGLMALDQTELKIIKNSGTKTERQYAEKIIPVRSKGNYLLCTLLLGNVIVNSSVSILLDDLTSGLIALIASSLGIVILGEIVPQSICSRYGLAVGAKTIWITQIFMVLTSPLSWPISKILDKILGDEVGHVYNRERLLELIKLSKDTQGGELGTCQEVQIVTGALELSHKTVKDVMTDFRDVFMVPSSAVLDSKTIGNILKSGYTRIPVYQDVRENIYTLLNVKDLALLDPDDRIPVKVVCEFYRHPIRFVLEDTPLNVMLDEFKHGHYHMAFVQRINSDGEGDPVYENIGLVTLEDIIEEIIQAEIMDETDVITDNRRRQRRKEVQDKDLSFFTDSPSSCSISVQLSLAAYQYLTATIEPFQAQNVSEHVLRRLIQQHVTQAKAPSDPDQQPKYLYTKGKPADYFILILEGRTEVITGEENFVFEAGPFFYFGKQALEKILKYLSLQSSRSLPRDQDEETSKHALFTPDFTVKVVQDVIYLEVSARTYLSAHRSSLIERQKTGNERKGVQSCISIIDQSCVTPQLTRSELAPNDGIVFSAHDPPSATKMSVEDDKTQVADLQASFAMNAPSLTATPSSTVFTASSSNNNVTPTNSAALQSIIDAAVDRKQYNAMPTNGAELNFLSPPSNNVAPVDHANTEYDVETSSGAEDSRSPLIPLVSFSPAENETEAKKTCHGFVVEPVLGSQPPTQPSQAGLNGYWTSHDNSSPAGINVNNNQNSPYATAKCATSNGHINFAANGKPRTDHSA